ncbi:MAG: Na+/H+ antiporter NhaA [Romboutsia sp.]
MRLLRSYKKTVTLEVATSLSLVLATICALIMYNSPLKSTYVYIFNSINLGNGFNLHMFINDFLMAIFFLVAGLEIKNEILFGNLSTFKKASFPVIASLGGVIVPALIFFIFNKDTPFLSGICIPISTDIAFAVGIFLIFRKKLNPSLKIFLLSLAVVDDLISIFAIGAVYSIDINYIYISISIVILFTLFIANRIFNVTSITYYLIGGFCLWFFVYLSGVHSTVSGVLLAMVIPHNNTSSSCLERMQRLLVPINSIFIIPLFAFANTGISLSFNSIDFSTSTTLSLGIVLGLYLGKPMGIMLFTFIGCFLGITEKPSNITWISVFLVSIIAGIGFTMSIFISEIAFIHNLVLVDIAKISILVSSVLSMVSSFIIISIYSIFSKDKHNKNTMNLSKSYIS